MEITLEDIEGILGEFYRRSAAIKLIGGVSEQEVATGRPIPDGWKRDEMLDFWVPPDFVFDPNVH